MLIVAVNVAFAVVFALINARYIISFEVAFIGAGLVFYSSYRAIMQKINIFANSVESRARFCDSNAKNAESAPRFCDSNAKNTKSNLDSANKPNIAESALDNLPKSTPENLPKKERFFLGAKISFGLLRILSYALLGISIIALINNGVFFLAPFLTGIALSTLASALYVARKGQRVVL